MIELFDHSGNKIILGRKFGAGGEGSVYEVPSLSKDVVAKIYHEPLPLEKQAKLHYMSQMWDQNLAKFSAWPLATLHKNSGGALCGFLMQRLIHYEPIHHLYGPQHRKQQFPEADWSFLVNVACNTSIAFHNIHTRNVVIGDINPNLVFVSEKSIVKFIDCDSFQFTANGHQYLCEVGVPHFTPPELQGRSNFRGIHRTKTHDQFGLAVLLFHILLMGRHPFSGIPSDSSDLPLEKAIHQCCYVFARNAKSKGILPPPKSVTPSILPDSIIALFEQAFSEQGKRYRPSAYEWFTTLDSLKKRLTTCNNDVMHKFYSGLSSCPWCEANRKSGILYFIPKISPSAAKTNFNLNQVWSAITAISPPGPAPVIDPSQFSVSATPLPPELTGLSGFFSYFSGKKDKEKERRSNALNSAQNRFKEISDKWKQEASDHAFQIKLRTLTNLRNTYAGLADEYQKELKNLENNLKNSQLKKFLSSYFLDDYNIPGVGPALKSTLSSFGIETAADISLNKIMSIRGFGKKRATDLVNWRNRLESKFVFNPSKGIDPADKAAIDQRFIQRKQVLEKELLNGLEQLKKIRTQILLNRSEMLPRVQDAARQVAQSLADLSIMV